MSGTGDLEVHRRPRVLLAVGVVVTLTALGLGAWHAGSPEPLPVSDAVVVATTPVGQPVYVGVFTAVGDFDRTLHLAGVKVHATSSADVEITPQLCKGGAIGTTTEPQAFCDDLVNPEGQVLTDGDAVVLEIVGDVPGVAVIDRVRLAFRESLQWGTLPAGSSAVVTVVGR